MPYPRNFINKRIDPDHIAKIVSLLDFTIISGSGSSTFLVNNEKCTFIRVWLDAFAGDLCPEAKQYLQRIYQREGWTSLSISIDEDKRATGAERYVAAELLYDADAEARQWRLTT